MIDKKIKNRYDLYSKTSKDKIMSWSIWSEKNDYGDGQTIVIEYGLIDGETQVVTEQIPFGLAGRTVEEQVELKIKSRVNKKLDSGYVTSIEAAKNGEKRNALGFKKPAKCHSWNNHGKNFPFKKTYVQNKLDGHHCNIVNDGGELIAYSSNGKIIDTIPEILASIEIPEGRTVEGELYHHGTPLQTISSWVKRRQEDTKKLKYYIYDIDLDECYSERYKQLNKLKVDNVFSKILETDLLVGEFEVLPLLKKAIDNKYEGLILRATGYPHMDGKRSKGMLKVKPIHFKGDFATDDEFLVVNILSSKDGWARLQCETEEGKRFLVSCHGDLNYRKEVLKNKDYYLYKHVRVEFAGWTKDKKPQHPVAIEWREKFEE